MRERMGGPAPGPSRAELTAAFWTWFVPYWGLVLVLRTWWGTVAFATRVVPLLLVWLALDQGSWALVSLACLAIARARPIGGAPWGTQVRRWLASVVALLAVRHAFIALADATVLPGSFPSSALLLRSLPSQFLFVSVMIGCGYAVELATRYRQSETRALLATARLTRSRLALLSAQLHPHYLFNALSSLSSLLYVDPPGARRMLSRLARLVWMSLRQTGRGLVPLSTEAELLARYVAVERARFRGELRVEIDVEPGAARAAVPPLILQPLVENALRHGFVGVGGVPHVRVTAALADDARLVLRIRDTGRGLPAGWSLESAGIGLGNTLARLEETYGREHTVTVAPHPAGGVLVELTLPARAPDAPYPELDEPEPEEEAAPGFDRGRGVPAWLLPWAVLTAVYAAGTGLAAVAGPHPAPAGVALGALEGTKYALVCALALRVALRSTGPPRARWAGRSWGPALAATALDGMLRLGMSAFVFGTPRTHPWITDWGVEFVASFSLVPPIFAAAYAVAYFRRDREARYRAALLGATSAHAEAERVATELDPRLLRFAFRAIRRAIRTDPDAADSLIASTGTLLRLVLPRGRRAATLADEVRYAETFCEILDAASPGRVRFRHDLSPEVLGADVEAPLLRVVLPALAAARGGTTVSLEMEERDGEAGVSMLVSGRGAAVLREDAALAARLRRISATHPLEPVDDGAVRVRLGLSRRAAGAPGRARPGVAGLAVA